MDMAANQVSLSCSIVIYKPEVERFCQTITSLAVAADRWSGAGAIRLLVVNNDPNVTEDDIAQWLERASAKLGGKALDVISGHGNIGYGRAHNLAMERSDGEYHLIVNPDVVLSEDALVQALEFMECNPQCGLLAARALDEGGAVQYLCKRYPTVTDLMLRGFMPAPACRLFRKRLDRYEMRDVIADDVVWDVPIVSGCFMLFRREVLLKLGGFSPDYFLYFEDFDLSLRANRVTRVAYVPQVKIVHFGGRAARKGWRHIAMFGRSAITFFNRHGWKWW